MKISPKLLISILLCTQHAFSQKQLQLRLSWGNGKPWPYKNTVLRSPNSRTTEKFNSLYRAGISNRLFNNPQYGIMLEYKWDKNNTIGIGLQKGRTEVSAIIYSENGTFAGSTATGATLNKWGLEYSRQFYMADYNGSNNGLNRVHFSLLAGAFWVRHRYNNYENDGMSPVTFLSKDSLGNTRDSTTSSARLLVPNGFIISVGFRVGLLSKVKKKEKLSVTFSYDHGFVTLWEQNYYHYHNYLKDFTIAKMTSRGNQFKVYLSIPIRLYAIDNK
jgi:hypothetical protein